MPFGDYEYPFYSVFFFSGVALQQKEKIFADASRSSELDFKEWFENSTYHLSALLPRKVMVCGEHNAQIPAPHALAMIQTKDSTAFPDPCRNFAFPPPPPGDRRQIGP